MNPLLRAILICEVSTRSLHIQPEVEHVADCRPLSPGLHSCSGMSETPSWPSIYVCLSHFFGADSTQPRLPPHGPPHPPQSPGSQVRSRSPRALEARRGNRYARGWDSGRWRSKALLLTGLETNRNSWRERQWFPEVLRRGAQEPVSWHAVEPSTTPGTPTTAQVNAN